jgi:hypothetical protein
MDEVYKPEFKLMDGLLVARYFNDTENFAFDVFCYFASYDEGGLVS